MKKDIRDSENWAIRQATRLSALMLADPTHDGVPAYAKSINALAVLFACAWRLPCYRQLAERVQQEHRDQDHAGGRSSACEACGWFEGATYKATTGREFLDDFPELLGKGKAAGAVRGSMTKPLVTIRASSYSSMSYVE